MFDIGAAELLVVAAVAILIIGPKDMPLALRTAGRWIGKARKLSGHFRSGLDAMVRDAELEDMEEKWKAQNDKIMRENPDGGPADMEPTGAYPSEKKPEIEAKVAEKSAENEAAADEVAGASAEAAIASEPNGAETPAKPSKPAAGD